MSAQTMSEAGRNLAWYIAAPLPLRTEAASIAAGLRDQGNTITSTWHDLVQSTVEYERECSTAEKIAIAVQVREQVRACDVVLVLLGPRSDRCGHVWEAAYGEGLGKDVRVIYSDLESVVPTILMLPVVERSAA